MSIGRPVLLLTGAALAGAVLLVAPLAVAGTASAAVSAPPRCHTADLRLSVVPETEARHHGGGMNHQGATIALRNTSRHSCRVFGYPGVTMLSDAGGRAVRAAHVVRGRTTYAGDPGPHRIVLRPGRSAYAELSWTSADGKRPAADVGWIVVTPPDERIPLRARLATRLGGDRSIRATALTAGEARLAR